MTGGRRRRERNKLMFERVCILTMLMQELLFFKFSCYCDGYSIFNHQNHLIMELCVITKS
jgi:hypothetical protein